jgi:hypothetical protein
LTCWAPASAACQTTRESCKSQESAAESLWALTGCLLVGLLLIAGTAYWHCWYCSLGLLTGWDCLLVLLTGTAYWYHVLVVTTYFSVFVTQNLHPLASVLTLQTHTLRGRARMACSHHGGVTGL